MSQHKAMNSNTANSKTPLNDNNDEKLKTLGISHASNVQPSSPFTSTTTTTTSSAAAAAAASAKFRRRRGITGSGSSSSSWIPGVAALKKSVPGEHGNGTSPATSLSASAASTASLSWKNYQSQDHYYGLPSQRPSNASTSTNIAQKTRERSYPQATFTASLATTSQSAVLADTSSSLSSSSSFSQPLLQKEVLEQQQPSSSSSTFSPRGMVSPLPPPLPLPETVHVCVSPACLADGALATLEALIALAPPHVTVRAGPCRSLCGSGPIVTTTTTTKTPPPTTTTTRPFNDISLQQGGGAPAATATVVVGGTLQSHTRRWNSPQKILERWYPSAVAQRDILSATATTVDHASSLLPSALSSNYTYNIQALYQGYQLGALEGAKALMEQQDYSTALKLFERAVAVAFRPAMELQQQYDDYHKKWQLQQQHQQQPSSTSGGRRFPPTAASLTPSTHTTTTGAVTTLAEPPCRLQWLIRVRRME